MGTHPIFESDFDCLTEMPCYHSSQVQTMPSLGNIAFLPLKGTTKGPAPKAPEDQEDIIDECIKFFKPNVFFKSFKPDNDADRLLIYVTLWIQECLKVLQKVTSKDQGWKELYTKSVQDFSIPGDSRFPLNNYLHKPKNPQESTQMREYIKVHKQIRLETSRRILDHALTPEGTPDKWWMCFTKKKFIGLSLSGPG